MKSLFTYGIYVYRLQRLLAASWKGAGEIIGISCDSFQDPLTHQLLDCGVAWIRIPEIPAELFWKSNIYAIHRVGLCIPVLTTSGPDGRDICLDDEEGLITSHSMYQLSNSNRQVLGLGVGRGEGVQPKTTAQDGGHGPMRRVKVEGEVNSHLSLYVSLTVEVIQMKGVRPIRMKALIGEVTSA